MASPKQADFGLQDERAHTFVGYAESTRGGGGRYLRLGGSADDGPCRSKAPSASKACRWASVTPVSPVMSTPSYRRSARSVRLSAPLLVSQSRTSPSSPPLATRRPSRLSATP